MTVFGYTIPNPTWLRLRRMQAQPGLTPVELTLENLPVGKSAQVDGFLAGLSAQRRTHLQSYGLVAGVWVQVSQHSPVTIVQVEHLELALENDLAEKIRVRPDPSPKLIKIRLRSPGLQERT